MSLEKLSAFLKTDEFKESLKKYHNDIENRNKIYEKQVDRLHNLNKQDFVNLIEKAIKKYDSTEYKMRWLGRGLNPQKSLFWLFYRYGDKYGIPCEKDMFSMFTSEMYEFHGYIVEVITGQGCEVLVYKK